MDGLSAVQIIDGLVEEACAHAASDIHILPGPDEVSVRYRVEGTLSKNHSVPLLHYNEVLTRLKVLSSVRIDERQVPQDGHFRHVLRNGESVDVRTAFIPTRFGERVALRLFIASRRLESLAALGCSSLQEMTIHRALQKGYGLILIVGATGSGKTSTFYVLLQLLSEERLSILTVEDPVEYLLPGLAQVQVHLHVGLDFAQGLRSILRQDPDVIGIGEIRDQDTATTALQAALTGHLVICTMHAADVQTAVSRLKHMGIKPYVLTASIQLVISQRLEQQPTGKRTGVFELHSDIRAYV